MKFIPTPPEQPSTLMLHEYYWQAAGTGEEEFHLFQGFDRVACLRMYEKEVRAAVMEVARETFEFSDKSSFFKANLLLHDKENGDARGRIERNTANPTEGTIKLEGQTYGWKFHNRPDPCLLMMDQKRRRLFSYHYNPAYVRLLLNKAGKEEEQLVPLLCIGLYLLPVWQSSQGTAEGDLKNGQESKNDQKFKLSKL